MFDVGFTELLLISVVALLVLGPDKLPGAIRTLGLWIGRLRRSFNNVKADIEREVGADEIRRQLRNEAIMDKLKHTKQQFTQSVDSVKKQTDSVKKDLNLENEFSGLKGNKPEGQSRQVPETQTGAAISPVASVTPQPQPSETLAPDAPVTGAPAPSGADPSAYAASAQPAPAVPPAAEPAPAGTAGKPTAASSPEPRSGSGAAAPDSPPASDNPGANPSKSSEQK